MNHAIAAAAADELSRLGLLVTYRDLYAEGFDPLLPAGEIRRDGVVDAEVARHCEQLAAADMIVIVHPNWWGQPPAILKGWIDRVVRPGVAYEFAEGDSGEGVPLGLLRAGVAIIFNTSNTPEARELGAFGDPLETLWWNCVFRLCGVRRFARRTYRVVVTSTAEEREAWIADSRRLVREQAAIVGGTC